MDNQAYEKEHYDGMFILQRSGLCYEYIVAVSYNNQINHQPWCKMLLLASSYNMCFSIDCDTHLEWNDVDDITLLESIKIYRKYCWILDMFNSAIKSYYDVISALIKPLIVFFGGEAGLE